MIPLWYGAKWFQYQTDKAVGWPNAAEPVRRSRRQCAVF